MLLVGGNWQALGGEVIQLSVWVPPGRKEECLISRHKAAEDKSHTSSVTARIVTLAGK